VGRDWGAGAAVADGVGREAADGLMDMIPPREEVVGSTTLRLYDGGY